MRDALVHPSVGARGAFFASGCPPATHHVGGGDDNVFWRIEGARQPRVSPNSAPDAHDPGPARTHSQWPPHLAGTVAALESAANDIGSIAHLPGLAAAATSAGTNLSAACQRFPRRVRAERPHAGRTRARGREGRSVVTAAAAAATRHSPHARVALESPSPTRHVCVGVDAVALWPRRADGSRTGAPARSVRAVTAVTSRCTRAPAVGEGAAASHQLCAVRGRRETAAAACGAAPKPPRRPGHLAAYQVRDRAARSPPFAARIGSEAAPGGPGLASLLSPAMLGAVGASGTLTEAVAAVCTRACVAVPCTKIMRDCARLCEIVCRYAGITMRHAHAGMLV